MDDIIKDVFGVATTVAGDVAGAAKRVIGSFEEAVSYLWGLAMRYVDALGKWALAELQRLYDTAARRSPYRGRPIPLESLVLRTVYEVFADAYGA